MDIIERTMRDAIAAFSALELEMGLAVNEGKTKYMQSTSADVSRVGSHIAANSYNFDVVK